MRFLAVFINETVNFVFSENYVKVLIRKDKNIGFVLEISNKT